MITLFSIYSVQDVVIRNSFSGKRGSSSLLPRLILSALSSFLSHLLAVASEPLLIDLI